MEENQLSDAPGESPWKTLSRERWDEDNGEGDYDRRLALALVDANLLAAITDESRTRDDVAVAYSERMKVAGPSGWGDFNRAIIDRWSLSALKYVKETAWRIAGRA